MFRSGRNPAPAAPRTEACDGGVSFSSSCRLDGGGVASGRVGSMNRDLKTRALPLEPLLRQAAWTRQLARSLVANDALADDVVQQTWLSALKRPSDPTQPLRPWLRSTPATSATATSTATP
jgi:hypothetical protein